MNEASQPLEWPAQVERVCLARGLTLTPLRRRVLMAISQAPAPLGAYAILDALASGGQKRPAPPTVYRALEFFLAHGFLHRIESRNAYARCEHIGHSHAGILMVCGRCGRSDEAENAAMERLLAEVCAGAGFAVEARVVELQGLCRACAKYAPARP